MYLVIEISKPFQIKPYIYSSRITWFRFCWLLFAISLHPGRYDAMLELAMNGEKGSKDEKKLE